MGKGFIQIANEKADSLSYHEKYPKLREQLDRAISLWGGYGLDCIIAADIIERLVAMPIEYIKDWLDGKNELEWRKEDRKMIEAIKMGCVDVLEKYPCHEIHKISEGWVDFYISCGHEVLKRDGNIVFVGKIEA